MEEIVRIDRRTTLAWFGAAIASTTVSLRSASANAASQVTPIPVPGAKGYGNDPDLQNPSAPWSKAMTPRQLQLSAALADLLLPPVGDAPAPSAVGIPDFVDEWVSAPYPDQQRDRGLILPGLLWLDTEATTRWSGSFTDVSQEKRIKLLSEISTAPTGKDAGAALRYGFFRRFRTVAVGAYYSLERNFAEIGYVGNTPLESFPPPTVEERVHIEAAIARLGI